jgi:predicted Zn-dependent protease
VDFWKRMAAQKEGKSPPEFLSTHPADKKRIAAIKDLLPDAMRYYSQP